MDLIEFTARRFSGPAVFFDVSSFEYTAQRTRKGHVPRFSPPGGCASDDALSFAALHDVKLLSRIQLAGLRDSMLSISPPAAQEAGAQQ